MNLFNLSWIVFLFLVTLLIILAIFPTPAMFMLSSLLGTGALFLFVLRVLKDDAPVEEGANLE